jgi:hypothetical protein
VATPGVSKPGVQENEDILCLWFSWSPGFLFRDTSDENKHDSEAEAEVHPA